VTISLQFLLFQIFSELNLFGGGELQISLEITELIGLILIGIKTESSLIGRIFPRVNIWVVRDT